MNHRNLPVLSAELGRASPFAGEQAGEAIDAL